MPTLLEATRIRFRESIAEEERMQHQEMLNRLDALANTEGLLLEQIPELQTIGPFGSGEGTGLRWMIDGKYGHVMVEINSAIPYRIVVYRSNGSGREESTLQGFKLEFYPPRDSSATQEQQETIERSRRRAVEPIVRHIAMLLEKL
jgi:hypothetical protein